ncbi:hypothetical protein LIPSTDRAFT_75938 [Lipomyces starkeyi NRRL Y-11557]|uniref:Uncharacterized protein n=1 Tax=Lipomyces starkeyi NRRL Y-11557 TaxID=675824 RepID=A0A1E3PWF7_LIPST|nr:hypothetical protein LIPSTDRAFT_75938 [Lipomyces starkeyi NRRL Y-11557]
MWSVHSFSVPSHMETHFACMQPQRHHSQARKIQSELFEFRNVKDWASESNIWLSRCSRNDDTTSMKSS